jgi:glycosyltransferase involved in cell wall biosynthesis
MRIVSLLAPIRSGIYQFHCNLSRRLTVRGCSVSWLCSGSDQANEIAVGGVDSSDGEVVAPDSDDMETRTRALVQHLSKISPHALICHALGDRIDLNAVRYLPDSIPRILVLHGSSLAVYRGAQAIRNHVNASVAISPRIKQDLVSTYGFREDRLKLIPHGVDITSLSSRSLIENSTGHLRILSHGRIDKEQKGVFWIPEILSILVRHSRDWSCTISGDGPDLIELKRRITAAGLSGHTEFVGWTPATDVPSLMNRHDVFLFPTSYEGYPIALIEAMAAGCVPVASRLPGITDWIVENGADGFLFPIGDVRLAAQHLLRLLLDRHRLTDLRRSAREKVSHYSFDSMAEQYYQLLREVLSHPRQISSSRSLANCELANGLKPAWWYNLPEPIKNYLRIARERIRTSVRIP